MSACGLWSPLLKKMFSGYYEVLNVFFYVFLKKITTYSDSQ